MYVCDMVKLIVKNLSHLQYNLIWYGVFVDVIQITMVARMCENFNQLNSMTTNHFS